MTTSLGSLQGVFEVLNKSIVRLAIPVALGALVLTACGSDDEGGDGSGGGTTYKIAYQGPLSGDNVALGENMQNGIQLAIKEANESGDYDFTIEYVAADDQGSETQATAAAQSAIDDQDVVAVIGPAFSGPANVAAPLYAQAGMPAVSSSATDPSLTEGGKFATFLRAVPNDNAQGLAMADFLAAQDGVESVMVIDDVTPYGEGLSEVAKAELEAAGLEVLSESVPADTVDYGGAANTVVDSGADALIYAGYYQALAPFATRLSEAGFDGIGISGDGSNDDELINLAGDAVEGWYLTCPCTDASEDEATAAFAETYESEYGNAPGTYSAESYDVANMIIDAIAGLGGDVSRESLYQALAGGEYEGLTKTFSFDENGEFTNTAIFMYQVEGDARTYLGGIEELVGG
ncbi:branched-chain amino acid ABC transporter substrate-binding protein [Streptomyces litchfieldiae]|uniref:Branched-chain amino acid ABC transporter substrate-binding protein n=1 Tax=Streptomyces litchfieldiae TaxID=3075543 RepID=A0ABU2MSU0_9ACTN|nr:branched-chain amino acid ABC transporter substrate-binding protein [Streptomyces sp. DSM 44938]MDT0344702.1 branched-chain amino acid ABC transporter substrate-binding protein [Streptomyces sp. DSM 44938]